MPLRRLLMLPLGLAVAAACGGDSSGPSEPGPAPETRASSLSVSPDSAGSNALGDTVTFSAVVRDGNGDAMSDVAIDWAATGDSVATVEDGDAVARGDGTARIIASAEGLADSAALTVEQEASRVTVTPAADTLTAGESIQLSAEAVDGNGNRIASPEVTWSSSDTTVATVGSTGLVRAKADGSANVTAGVGAAAGASTVTVIPPPDGAPVLSSVSPSPVPEGGTATISGHDFSPEPGSNTVLVDGDTARVTSATSTALEIDVPVYDCLPARTVAVEVTTSAGSASSSFQLGPDEPALSLAGGEKSRIESPGEFCLQFPATGDPERYLVGVQSLASTASSLTPVQITAEAVGGSGSALQASLEESGGPGSTSSTISAFDLPERWRAHRETEIELRRKERDLRRSGGAIPLTGGGPGMVTTRISVDSTTAEGDTVSIRVPDITASNLCAGYTEVGAVVKVVGTRAIVVADTGNPANGYTDADYRDLADRIDQDIFATQVSYFGQPTDIDSNGHIVAVFTKELNRASPNTLGFVSSTDLYDRSSCESSNEGEYFYGKVPDPNGTYGSTYSVSAARQDAPFVMAHELTHVIQQSRRLLDGKPWMGSTVAEAQATLSEEVVGHAVTGRQSGQNYGYDVAYNASGTDEFDWYGNAFTDLAYYFGYGSSGEVSGAPEECGWWQSSTSPCGGRPFWYGVGWSFLRWVTDRYGPGYPGGETGFHRNLVDGDQDGLATIESLTGEPREKLMGRWAASLYVDDRMASPEPYLETSSWDYFDVFEGAASQLPESATLNPAEMGFADWTLNGDVRASSAAYVVVESSGRPATAIRVRDGTGGTLPSDMQIWVVRLQ